MLLGNATRAVKLDAVSLLDVLQDTICPFPFTLLTAANRTEIMYATSDQRLGPAGRVVNDEAIWTGQPFVDTRAP